MELRPSVFNALVPELFLKVIIPGALISGVAWLVSWFTPADAMLGIGAIPRILSSWRFHAIVWGLLVLPFLWELILLSRTRYVFGPSTVTREFSLIAVRKLAVPYAKIVHIKTRISVWDRICKAGTLELRTAEDSHPDLSLRFIPDPERVEAWLVAKLK
jgi:hypothetical protein